MAQAEVTAQEFRPRPEPRPPVERAASPVEWLRLNLFNTWYNSVLTLVLAPAIAWVVYLSLRFVFVTGRWTIIEVNLTNFMVGGFPRDQLWRPWLAAFILAVAVGLFVGRAARATSEAAAERGVATERSWSEVLRRVTPLLLLVAVVAVFVRTPTPLLLLAGAAAVTVASFVAGRRIPSAGGRWVNLGLIVGLFVAYQAVVGFGGVPLRGWGGLMLTLFYTVGGIALAFPLGVLVALGRRSTLPAVRWVCVAYVEFFRGVPLIALLFMAWLLLGFFMTPGFPTPSLHTRVLVAFVLFTAAYIAEIVRGGLQSVPRGQYEAARAVGLPPWKVTRLVVLPQALRNVIPALVGQFISLFKDTTLVLVVGFLDLLRVARTVTAQPRFLGQGLHAEALVFVSFIFWVGCYWMSRESQRLERRLGLGER
jgi:general L-amino acid transport system permease protein